MLVAVGFEILKIVGSIYVPRAIASSSALYGAIGVVFAVLAWFALYGRLIVYGAVLNVVRYERPAGTVTVEIEVPRIDGRGAAHRHPRRGRRREGGGAALITLIVLISGCGGATRSPRPRRCAAR